MSEQQIQRDVSSRGGVRHVQKICRTIRKASKIMSPSLSGFFVFRWLVLIFPAALQARTDDTKEVSCYQSRYEGFLYYGLACCPIRVQYKWLAVP